MIGGIPMKVKVQFMEFWFRTKDGKPVYRCHYQFNEEETSWVPSTKKYNYGDEIVLGLGRDKDGRTKVIIKQ